jgi:hypothetical protein
MQIVNSVKWNLIVRDYVKDNVKCIAYVTFDYHRDSLKMLCFDYYVLDYVKLLRLTLKRS